MAQLPLVSVIIPAFNAELFLSECLDSIINQTYKNIEIILVDDGSTDNTKKIIDEFIKNHNNVFYHYQQNNGCSHAKNTGLGLAEGAFIQYLDADDVLSVDKIESQVNAIKELKCAIAVCKTVAFESMHNKNTNTEIDSSFLYSTKDTLSFVLNLYGINGKIGMIQPNAFLLSKEITDKIKHWNTNLSPSPDEDGEYFCRAMLEAEEIIFTDGINYYRKIKSIPSLSKQKSLEYAKGAIMSVVLKKQHVLSKIDTLQVRKTFAVHFALCIYMYSKDYPQLIEMVKKEIEQLGVSDISADQFKGWFGFFTKYIGFWNALIFKNFIQRKVEIFKIAFKNLFPSN